MEPMSLLCFELKATAGPDDSAIGKARRIGPFQLGGRYGR